MSWDPEQYRRFSGERLRPALDLLAAIPLEAPESIVDLGCGEGRVTRLLAERWPGAAITGVDSSDEMLAVAARELPAVRWIRGDVGRWRADQPVDLLFSNAALHWLDDHATLFPALAASVRPGGVLAVQMPGNFDAPSHRLLTDLAMSAPWRERLGPLVRLEPVKSPAFYYDCLSPASRKVDIWETTYLQLLTGENPVVEWIKGTWLKPFLDRLSDEERPRFEAEYRRLVREAYPSRADGTTLYPFRRLFLVATIG